jgi:predicted AAA+ superfamily ATPase
MVDRLLAGIILEDLTWAPIVGIVGPRQVGKTTLVKSLIPRIAKECVYLDMELPSDYRKMEDAESYLLTLENKCVIIDEVQLVPSLFPLLRALVDRQREPARFILLGSAAPHVVRQVTETLAGRITYHELSPLSSSEVRPRFLQNDHWLRGGFPDALLSSSERISRRWLEDFIQTFIQRDLSRLGFAIPLTTMRRLVEMLAHLNGNLLNLSTLGKSIGVTHGTVARYLELLEGSFLIRRLSPYHANLGKQLVKSPKVYFRDTGLLHHLLGIQNYDRLRGHPGVGNSWEAYVLEQIMREAPEFSKFNFYRTRSGAEINLLMTRPDGEKWAIEVKLSASPKVSRGFFTALEDVGAQRAFVIAPVGDAYPYQQARVLNLEAFLGQL